MIDFEYYNPTKIIFGKESEEKIGAAAKELLGGKVLVHYGGGSAKKSGLLDRVFASLKEAGVEYVELGGVVPNPRLSLALEGIELCRRENVTGILAVGGGSVIDSAKCIAIGVPFEGDVWDCFINKATPQAGLPVGSVLTIPAAGSESSTSCVMSNDDGLYKRGFHSPYFRPRFAVINPQRFTTLPPFQTACGCVDILAHLMERYFTQIELVDYSDRLIEASMRTVIDYAPIALAQPDDYNARAQIGWCGTLAHNNLLDCGRIGDWGSHGIEHEISAIYEIAHGAGLAIVFPAWMKYVYKLNVPRFVQFAVRVWGVELPLEDSEAIIHEGIARYERFVKSLGLPTRLSDIGAGTERIREMAEKTVVHMGGTRGNFLKMTADDVEKILQLAL